MKNKIKIEGQGIHGYYVYFTSRDKVYHISIAYHTNKKKKIRSISTHKKSGFNGVEIKFGHE